MISIQNITKTYSSSASTVTAVKELNLTIKASEFVLLKGHSGSGKSTLLFYFGRHA